MFVHTTNADTRRYLLVLLLACFVTCLFVRLLSVLAGQLCVTVDVVDDEEEGTGSDGGRLLAHQARRLDGAERVNTALKEQIAQLRADSSELDVQYLTRARSRRSKVVQGPSTESQRKPKIILSVLIPY